MISDMERREAVENLRYLSDGNRVRYKEEFFELLDETVMEPDTGYHEMNDVFDRLADLIDRSTCHDTSDNDFEFKCSKCSAYTLKPGNYHSEVGYMRDSGEHLHYCPNCGAEVVDA